MTYAIVLLPTPTAQMHTSHPSAITMSFGLAQYLDFIMTTVWTLFIVVTLSLKIMDHFVFSITNNSFFLLLNFSYAYQEFIHKLVLCFTIFKHIVFCLFFFFLWKFLFPLTCCSLNWLSSTFMSWLLAEIYPSCPEEFLYFSFLEDPGSLT